MEEQSSPPTIDKANSNQLFWKLLATGVVVFVCLGSVTVMALMMGVFFGLNRDRLTGPPPFTPQPTPLPYNQIAYIGNDDNLWLMEPDGTSERQLTTDGQHYRQPTWSPDNQHLAFIGNDPATNTPALYVSPVEVADPTILYSQPDAAPFYLYWSPDSEAITFLSQQSAEMALHHIEIDEPYRDVILETGSPFFWAWSPAADSLVLHVGGDSKKAHISFLEAQIGAEPDKLDLDPGRFQSPIWSPDNQYIYYAVADGQRKGIIYKRPVDSDEEITLAKLKGPAHLTLSPNGEHLLYMQFERRNEPPFGMAYLVDTNGDNHRLITENPVASAYWSPDSSKIALLTLGLITNNDSQAKAGGLAAPLPQETVHRWWVYDVATQQMEVLKSFNPTDDFAQTMTFFDQYHLSLTFWSPDSRYFLVIEKDPENSAYGQIWLIDTTFEEDMRQIAPGTMAVWSWR